MNLQKCAKGHFYDTNRYSSCPYCNGTGGGATQTSDMTGTIGVNDRMSPTEGAGSPVRYHPPVQEKEEQVSAPAKDEFTESVSIFPAMLDDEKTKSIYDSFIGNTQAPVVGWLVCVEGEHMGEDFRLVSGRNFIGRSSDMDVALTKDHSISRNKHAIVVYEPKSNVFMIQPGDSRELSYLNEKVILQTEQIEAYDMIALGKTKLVFIPFCNMQFQWSEKTED